jgi:hypothetical protein
VRLCEAVAQTPQLVAIALNAEAENLGGEVSERIEEEFGI